MPDSKLPDISLQILFSMSRPHMLWYSWKTDKEKDHGWVTWSLLVNLGGWRKKKNFVEVQQCWDYTPARRWGLLRAHRMALNWDSSVPTLFSPAPYSFCRPSRHRNVKKKRNTIRLPNYFPRMLRHQTDLPECPVWPGRCQRSLFRHDFPRQSKTHWAH